VLGGEDAMREQIGKGSRHNGIPPAPNISKKVPRVGTSMSPATRASLFRNANPQLTLWAKICRQLRWLGVGSPDAGVQM
jgi:hypothetical protein